MKTIAKTLVAISILMISLQVIAGGNPDISAKVHYKVQIHLPKAVLPDARNIIVVLTDENNKMVAPPQLFRYGMNTYDFIESNSVNGFRVAKLISTDPNAPVLFTCSPDVQKGSFMVGREYLFNLYVTILTPVKQDD